MLLMWAMLASFSLPQAAMLISAVLTAFFSVWMTLLSSSSRSQSRLTYVKAAVLWVLALGTALVLSQYPPADLAGGWDLVSALAVSCGFLAGLFSLAIFVMTGKRGSQEVRDCCDEED